MPQGYGTTVHTTTHLPQSVEIADPFRIPIVFVCLFVVGAGGFEFVLGQSMVSRSVGTSSVT